MAILLCRRDMAGLLDMEEVIEVLAGAFSDLAQGQAVLPLRTPILMPEHAGGSWTMPAYLKGSGALGVKLVSVYSQNPVRHQMPTTLATILVQDSATGEVVAAMEGGSLTAVRTGAVAGLAARLLAREDARVHTLIGTGGMARAQVWAVSCVRSIEKLVMYSLDPMDKRKEFMESLRDLVACPMVLAEDPAQAVAEADIITLMTSSASPVLDGRWLRSGTHINGMGSPTPTVRELDTLAVQRAGKVVCDQVEACKSEAGDLIIPAERGEWSWDRACGLGDLVAGKVPGRQSASEITLFKSVGLAIQDIATAAYVYRKALAQKVGTPFDFRE